MDYRHDEVVMEKDPTCLMTLLANFQPSKTMPLARAGTETIEQPTHLTS